MGNVQSVAIAALAAGCAFLSGALVARTGPAEAQQAGTSYAGGTVDGNKRFIAATGSVGSGMSVLWLVDTEAKRVLVYGTGSLGKSLELRAARNIEWDLRLDEYHDDSQYKAEDLQRLAERQARDKGVQVPADKAQPEAPGPGKQDGGK